MIELKESKERRVFNNVLGAMGNTPLVTFGRRYETGGSTWKHPAMTIISIMYLSKGQARSLGHLLRGCELPQGERRGVTRSPIWKSWTWIPGSICRAALKSGLVRWLSTMRMGWASMLREVARGYFSTKYGLVQAAQVYRLADRLHHCRLPTQIASISIKSTRTTMQITG